MCCLGHRITVAAVGTQTLQVTINKQKITTSAFVRLKKKQSMKLKGKVRQGPPDKSCCKVAKCAIGY